jgi:hypothetical protein
MTKKKRSSSKDGRKKSVRKKKTKKSPKRDPKKRASTRRANLTEKPVVERLLKQLCAILQQPERTGCGRKPHLLSDIMFCLIYKVYILWSAQRTASTFDYLLSEGLITRKPSDSALHHYFNLPGTREVLEKLLATSALFLALVDRVYLIDSTYFIQRANLPYRRRFPNARTVKVGKGKKYIRLHVICGVETLIVMAAIPASMSEPEQKFVQPLLKMTRAVRAAARAKAGSKLINKELPEEAAQEVEQKLEGIRPVVYGDKNYASKKLKSMAHDVGFELVATLKKNSKDKQQQLEAMRDEDETRNSIESFFSMLKQTYRRNLKNDNEEAAYNEALCKAICHNLVTLHRHQERTSEIISFEG